MVVHCQLKQESPGAESASQSLGPFCVEFACQVIGDVNLDIGVNGCFYVIALWWTGSLPKVYSTSQAITNEISSYRTGILNHISG